MILLPTKNNPQNIERFIYHYQKTEAKVPVFLLCNHDDASLDGFKIPDYFYLCKLEVEDPSVSKINDAFINRFPCAPWYGFFTDKVIPRTKCWDRLMLKALKRYPFVHCRDLYSNALNCNIYFIRGDLMRAHGAYAPTPMRHYYLDTYWFALTDYLGIKAYIDNLVLEYSKEDRAIKETEEWQEFAKTERSLFKTYMESKKWHQQWYDIQEQLNLPYRKAPNITIVT